MNEKDAGLWEFRELEPVPLLYFFISLGGYLCCFEVLLKELEDQEMAQKALHAYESKPLAKIEECYDPMSGGYTLKPLVQVIWMPAPYSLILMNYLDPYFREGKTSICRFWKVSLKAEDGLFYQISPPR